MDRVRFEEDERLDLPDTVALQNLVYEYIGRMLGAFMGRPLYDPNSPIGGWLTCSATQTFGGKIAPRPFTFIPSTVSLSFSPGQFYFSDFTANGLTGEVLEYNPFATEQDSIELDLTAFVPNKTPFTLWAHSVDVPTKPENRKFWDAVAQNEITGNLNTRILRRMSFVAAAGKSSPTGLGDGVRPFKVGKCVDYNQEGHPIIHPIWAFDTKVAEGFNIPDFDSYSLQMLQNTDTTLENSGFGIIGHMQNLRSNIAKLYDADYQITGNTWLDPTLNKHQIGLKQLDEQMTAIEDILDKAGITGEGEFFKLQDDVSVLNGKMLHLKRILHDGSLCVRAWARYAADGTLTDFSAGSFGQNNPPRNNSNASGGNVSSGVGTYTIKFEYFKQGATGDAGDEGPGINYKNFEGDVYGDGDLEDESPFGCVLLSVEHSAVKPMFVNGKAQFRAGMASLGPSMFDNGLKSKTQTVNVMICETHSGKPKDAPFTVILLGPGSDK